MSSPCQEHRLCLHSGRTRQSANAWCSFHHRLCLSYQQTAVGLLQVALEGEADAAMQAIARTAKHRLERGIWTSPGAGQPTHHTMLYTLHHRNPSLPPSSPLSGPIFGHLLPLLLNPPLSPFSAPLLLPLLCPPSFPPPAYALKVPAWLHAGFISVSCN